MSAAATDTILRLSVPNLPTSHPRLSALVAGLFYSLAMALAFPPQGMWPGVFVALIPIFHVAGAAQARPATLAFFTALGILPFWMYEEFWISRITGAGYAPMCFLLCVFGFAQMYLIVKLRRRCGVRRAAIPASIIWCGIHILRGEFAFDGYPWYFEGHPLAGYCGGLGSVIGAYGITLLVVLINAFITDSLLLKCKLAAGMACSLLCLWFGLNAVSTGTNRHPHVRIGIVQTNVPQDIKAGGTIEDQIDEWKTIEKLTRDAAAFKPAVIVWPETMKPGLSLDAKSVQAEKDAGLIYRVRDANGAQRKMASTEFVDALLKLQKELAIPIIVGEEAFTNLHFPQTEDGISIKYDARFNSAFVVENGEAKERRYDKLHLTPFGEYMPYIRSWPWLQKQLLAIGAQGMRFDLTEGKDPTQLTINVPVTELGGKQVIRSLRIATPICFEIADVPTVRKLAEGADLIVNLTNDGWFGDSDRTRQQHAQLGHWRAIECGIPVVRSANTGLSSAFRPDQMDVAIAEGSNTPQMRSAGVCVVDVPIDQGKTLFMSGGWTLPWFILTGMGALIVWTLFGKSKIGPPATEAPSVQKAS